MWFSFFIIIVVISKLQRYKADFNTLVKINNICRPMKCKGCPVKTKRLLLNCNGKLLGTTADVLFIYLFFAIHLSPK